MSYSRECKRRFALHLIRSSFSFVCLRMCLSPMPHSSRQVCFLFILFRFFSFALFPDVSSTVLCVCPALIVFSSLSSFAFAPLAHKDASLFDDFRNRCPTGFLLGIFPSSCVVFFQVLTLTFSTVAFLDECRVDLSFRVCPFLLFSVAFCLPLLHIVLFSSPLIRASNRPTTGAFLPRLYRRIPCVEPLTHRRADFGKLSQTNERKRAGINGTL